MIVTFLWSGQITKGILLSTTKISIGYMHTLGVSYGTFNIISSAEKLMAMTQHGPVKILAVE